MASDIQEVGVRAVVEGVGSYVSAAGQVSRSTDDINRATGAAETSARAFVRAQQAQEAQARRTAEALNTVGRSSLLLGTAIAAPGTAALAFASNFESAMVKVSTLSGVAAADIGKMTQGVKDIARETGQGPEELARGLLIVTSTGIRGAEALDILRASAKSAAVGLGDVGDIARTITSAVTAFRAQGLTAAHAADVLFATVREGGAEVDQVAGSLGRVIGIAAIVGLTFEDVGASVATFTRLGVDASTATTGLRATLQALLGNSPQTAKALAEVGLSAEKLLNIARAEGLPAALATLTKAFQGNLEGLSNVIPEARALADVLGTAGVQGVEFQRILDANKNSLGDVDRAMAQTAETSAFKFKQAVTDLKLELIALGSAGLPAFSALLGAITPVIGLLSDLPTGVQAAVLAMSVLGGGALIIVGTLGLLAGSLLQIVTVAPLAGAALAGIAANPATWIALAVAVGLAGVAYVVLKGQIDQYKQSQEDGARASALATQASKDELLARLRLLSAEREETVVLLNAEKAKRDDTGASSGSLKVMSELSSKVDALDGQIRAYSGAVNQKGAEEAQSAKTAKAMADATAAAGAAAGGAAEGLDVFGVSILETQKKLAAMTGEALATMVVLNDLKALAALGPTVTKGGGEIDVLGAEAFRNKSPQDQAIDILKRAEALRARVAEATKTVTHGAGFLTKDEQSAGKKAADDAAAEAKRAAEEAARDAAQAAEAAQRAREQEGKKRIADLDRLGELVVTALKRQAQKELDVTLEGYSKQRESLKSTINNEIEAVKGRRDAAVKAAEQARDASIKAAEQTRDATLAAIKTERDARVGALQAQIDALDQTNNAETRARLVREVALSYDADKRAAAEQALRDFDRQQQKDALQKQITVVQDSAQTQTEAARKLASDTIDATREAAALRIDQIKEVADALVKADEKARDAALATIDVQEKATRAAYAAATDEFTLQSKARIMVMTGEIGTIAKLLDAQVPEWRVAGQSFGEQLIQGVKASGVETYIQNLLGQLSRLTAGAAGGSVGAVVAVGQNQQQSAYVTGLQQQGLALVGAHAPAPAIEQVRKSLTDVGAIPKFSGGLDVGVVKRPILASLDTGEVVLTPDQQRRYMGGTNIHRGAFEGMFNGAQFNGSPEDNARAIRREFEQLLSEQLGRDAYLHGV